jgi:hypothetical protein
MKSLRYAGMVLLLTVVCGILAAKPAAAVDLRQAVPADAYLAVYGRHNPERDYQRKYLEDIWQTVKDERLVERAVEIITANVSKENMEQAKGVFDELKTAVEPIDWKALADAQAVAYAAVMQVPTAQHLVLVELTPDSAAGCEAAVKNLFADVQKHSDGQVPVVTATEGSVELTSLALPPGVPFRPTVARVEGVLVLSTSEALVRQSVGMLNGSGQPSKFDDPRLKEALSKLPAPEDALVFFDGKQLFSQLRKLGPFIREQSHGDKHAALVAGIMEQVIDQAAIVNYVATSKYTEGYRDCAESLIKLDPAANDKVLGQMLKGNPAFEDWQRWVPADATAYSLGTGVNLHPLYEYVVKVIREDIPNGDQILQQFDQLQDQVGVHVDKDILQAFDGEYVQVVLPAVSPSAMGSPDKVLALRCSKPDRIRELLHRGIEALQQIPAVQAQQLKLSKCGELEGFEKLSLTTMAMMGAEPVIGFREGWMIIGTRAAAVQKVLDTRSGSAPNAAGSEQFQKFDVEVKGPVDALSYRNLAAGIHQTANTVRQIGMIGPMIVAMAGAQANAKDLQPVLDAMKLLPDVANVIDKFDFLQAELCVTQAGSEPDTYVSRSVILIRPPAESKPAEHQPAAAADQSPSNSQ